MSTPAIATTMTSRIALPSETYSLYTEQAVKKSKSAEDLMGDRLTQFAQIDSVKPIVLSDSDRQALERQLSRNFDTASDLVGAVHHALSISIDGMSITLSPKLIDRLKSRCLGESFDKFLTRLIQRSLEEFVGLR